MNVKKNFWTGITVHLPEDLVLSDSTTEKGILKILQGEKTVSLKKSSGWGWFSWIFCGAVRIQAGQSAYYVKKSSFTILKPSDNPTSLAERVSKKFASLIQEKTEFPIVLSSIPVPKGLLSEKRKKEAEKASTALFPSPALKEQSLEKPEEKAEKASADTSSEIVQKPLSGDQPTRLSEASGATVLPKSDSTGSAAIVSKPVVPKKTMPAASGVSKPKGDPLLAQVYKDTVKAAREGYSVDGKKVEAPNGSEQAKKMQADTLFYEEPLRLSEEVSTHPTTFDVVNCDAIDCALQLTNPCVLNLANAFQPGGGVDEGQRAQEEALFRRTNLYFSLRPDLNPHLKTQMDSYIESKGHQGTYLIPPHGGIYTPGACVFRGPQGEQFPFLPEPKFLSFIAAAAPDLRVVGRNFGMSCTGLEEKLNCTFSKDKREKIEVILQKYEKSTSILSQDHIAEIQGIIRSSEAYKEEIKNRIRGILRIAAAEGHTSLVLGAFGCGVFLNDPEVVAGLYKDVFQEPEFCGHFEKVVFAVLSNPSDTESNFAIFERVFASGPKVSS